MLIFVQFSNKAQIKVFVFCHTHFFRLNFTELPGNEQILKLRDRTQF